MKKLFLLTSFSGHVNYDTGEVNPEHRQHIEGIIEALRGVGEFTVFCAIENEKWIIAGDMPPEVGVQEDLKQIEESDIILALLPAGLISGGLQYEAGYADAKGKEVIMASETGAELGYWNQGVVNLKRVKHIQYDSPESLATQVAELTD